MEKFYNQHKGKTLHSLCEQALLKLSRLPPDASTIHRRENLRATFKYATRNLEKSGNQTKTLEKFREIDPNIMIQ